MKRLAWVMLGLPEETPQLIEKTLGFIRKTAPDMVVWSVYNPLPGTHLYDFCLQKGYLGDDWLTPYDGDPDHKVPVLNQPTLSSDEIKYFCSRFRELEQSGLLVTK